MVPSAWQEPPGVSSLMWFCSSSSERIHRQQASHRRNPSGLAALAAEAAIG